MTEALQEIQRQVMWNRLIAVVEEQAQAILRTAFGSVVREAGDLSRRRSREPRGT
jgi:N-methylhydantoinase B